jgi:hypothetical protein
MMVELNLIEDSSQCVIRMCFPFSGIVSILMRRDNRTISYIPSSLDERVPLSNLFSQHMSQ